MEQSSVMLFYENRFILWKKMCYQALASLIISQFKSIFKILLPLPLFFFLIFFYSWINYFVHLSILYFSTFSFLSFLYNPHFYQYNPLFIFLFSTLLLLLSLLFWSLLLLKLSSLLLLLLCLLLLLLLFLLYLFIYFFFQAHI